MTRRRSKLRRLLLRNRTCFLLVTSAVAMVAAGVITTNAGYGSAGSILVVSSPLPLLLLAAIPRIREQRLFRECYRVFDETITEEAGSGVRDLEKWLRETRR